MKRIEEEEDSCNEELSQEEENQEELIKRILDESEKVEFKEFDEKQLLLTLSTLEKKYTKNQEQRVKFVNQPEKFMESEVELDEEIKKVQQISSHPELINSFLENNGLKTIFALLNHENNDIVGDVIDVKH